MRIVRQTCRSRCGRVLHIRRERRFPFREGRSALLRRARQFRCEASVAPSHGCQRHCRLALRCAPGAEPGRIRSEIAAHPFPSAGQCPARRHDAIDFLAAEAEIAQTIDLVDRDRETGCSRHVLKAPVILHLLPFAHQCRRKWHISEGRDRSAFSNVCRSARSARMTSFALAIRITGPVFQAA